MKENQDSEIKIDVQNDEKSIVKFGLGLTAFFFFVAVLMFVILGFLYFGNEPLTSATYFAISIFFFIVGRKYIASTFYKQL